MRSGSTRAEVAGYVDVLSHPVSGRLSAALTRLVSGVAAVATAAALGACTAGTWEPGQGAAKAASAPRAGPGDGVGFVPWRDPGYFPHQFPPPGGEVESLPAQF